MVQLEKYFYTIKFEKQRLLFFSFPMTKIYHALQWLERKSCNAYQYEDFYAQILEDDKSGARHHQI